MICLGVSDLFKAVSKKFEGNMRKPEEIPGNPDCFHYFIICLGVSDLFKAVSRKIKGNMRKPEEIPENLKVNYCECIFPFFQRKNNFMENAFTVIALPNHQKKSLTHILIFLDYEVLLL